MKTAKEMFEEFGYEVVSLENTISVYGDKFSIIFYKHSKDYTVDVDNITHFIEAGEHLAIHQQMKELGWIE